MRRIPDCRTAPTKAVKRYTLLLATVAIAALTIWAGHRTHVALLGAHQVLPPRAVSALTPPELEAGLTVPIPEQLPAFSLKDRDGRATPISKWRGKSLIINFWATWCAPCRREMPLLQALDRDWAAQDFRVIGIAVDQHDSVVDFADSLGIGYPLLIGEQDALDVAAKLGVTSPAFPFTVFTDRHAQIVALYVGELHKEQTDLILSVVSQVNRHTLAPDEARQRIADGLAKLKANSSV
jgi:thiol-disulfide isomerase/thioredoxin